MTPACLTWTRSRGETPEWFCLDATEGQRGAVAKAGRDYLAVHRGEGHRARGNATGIAR